LRRPQRSGALNRTLKANKSKSNVTITVGNRTTVPYAYTFHAVALGKSKGGFTFYVPPYNRRGRQVGAYKAARRIVSNPFLYIAWERSKDKIVEAYVTAMTKLIETA
jgi:hypothetical protein